MKKFIILLVMCLFLLPSCYETKRQAASSRKGLMMMNKNEYERNKKVYKPSKKNKKIKKQIQKRIYKKSYGKNDASN